MAEVEFTWALDGYCARYGFLAQPGGADYAGGGARLSA